MKIGPKGLDLIKGEERFVPFVYDDKISPPKEWKGGAAKGTLTIGYGHTNAGKHPLKIKQGLRIAEKEALEILDVDLDQCEDAVNRLVKVDLSQGQFDALVSFTFNCGVQNLQKIIRSLNNGNYNACCAKFGEFIHSHGEVMNGLIRRRKLEQALFNDPYNIRKPDAEVQAVPKVSHDDAPSQVTKLVKSKTAWASVTAASAPVISAFSDWKIAAVVLGFIALGVILYLRSQKP